MHFVYSNLFSTINVSKILNKSSRLCSYSDTFTKEKVFHNVITIYEPYIADQMYILIAVCDLIQLQPKFFPL